MLIISFHPRRVKPKALQEAQQINGLAVAEALRAKTLLAVSKQESRNLSKC
jgi:hypothetical protein